MNRYLKTVLFLVLMLLVGCGAVTPSTMPLAATAIPPTATTRTAAAPSQEIAAPLRQTFDSTRTATLSGTIVIDGSSTVFPISDVVAREFATVAPAVQIQLGVSGTGGGFKKFCAGETDLSAASRPIKQSEKDACRAQNIRFVEIPVAFDGLSVVVHQANTWVTCVTVAELKHLWEPAATNTITTWQQLRPEWPASPVQLYGAGADSGTFDYFTSAIVGSEGASRTDYIGSEDDYLLAQDIASDPNALGYFGYAYYREYRDRLKLVAIDGGDGCILPSESTIADGTYQPLSRPIFIYVRADALDRPAVASFVEFYLTDLARVVQSVQYVPLPPRAYQLAAERVRERKLGSVFSGGSQVNVSIEELLKLEGK